ncbi:MAG TPA: hypothetical protein VJ044_08285, partial [Candidatus Hodarchaeales archaeon]|nr:hypothetical protein [Candidatus Hodarchaeales archaeon]
MNKKYALIFLVAMIVPMIFTGSALLAATQSPVANTASSSYITTPPKIDGKLDIGEWNLSTAFRIDLAGYGYAYLMNDAIRLYVLLDVLNDTTSNAPLTSTPWGDYFSLAFDVDRNSQITPNEDKLYGLVPGKHDIRYSYFT